MSTMLTNIAGYKHESLSGAMPPSNGHNARSLSGSWKKRDGKYVTLVEPDITWYSLKEKENRKEISGATYQKNNGTPLGRGVIDGKRCSRPNMAQVSDQVCEPFGIKYDQTQMEFDSVSCFLIFVILLLIIIRQCVYRH